MIQICVCDDDKNIVEVIAYYLKKEGYKVFECFNGQEALNTINQEKIDLLIIDIMMPVLDGISTVIQLRQDNNLPVIFLSAKSEETDKIVGLKIGADDYVTKPFSAKELIARVQSQLRRHLKFNQQTQANELRVGNIILNDETKEVSVDYQPVNLTPLEYQILKLLMSKPGRVYSSQQIYELIWEDEGYDVGNTIAVHIRHLREKIEINPKDPRYLKIVWGVGYKIEKEAV